MESPNFYSIGGEDFSDVGYIKYTFDPSEVSSVDFSIGPLITGGGDAGTSEKQPGVHKGDLPKIANHTGS